MNALINILEERISAAIAAATGQEGLPALVKPTADAKFGDYQANGVMAAAKRLKVNPRQLAEKVIAKLDLADICESPEIAGPGFINLRLNKGFLVDTLLRINSDPKRFGIDKTTKPQTVVVDFSCPNIAKQMHVGHLRSTIIGDCICRMLEFEGHTVKKQNHIGDWGTPMGMLLALADERNTDLAQAKGVDSRGTVYVPSQATLADMERDYKEANARCESDVAFAQRAKACTVRLQNHDPAATTQWRIFCKLTLNACNDIYETLDVSLTDDDVRGESAYTDMLPGVVQELKDKGIAVQSEGAMCVFAEGFANKDGERLPFIVQKSDGAFLYATTDLAALKYRIEDLHADRIIYVTDARQKLHFEMLFATARLAGWVREGVELVHVTFGTVLGEDNRPLKTRSGENIKLSDLLKEAVERARAVVEQKNPELDELKKADIANAVGIGAVKYADYANNRESDYVFSFDRMLAMEGNTAPYMQYAYARVKSIERKAQKKGVDAKAELAGISEVDPDEAAELDLAKHIIRYAEAIESAAADCRPNYLTTYLYVLAQKFSGFYNACPVLDADEAKRPTRLLLCDLTARTIRHGLSELLGIRVVEQM